MCGCSDACTVHPPSVIFDARQMHRMARHSPSSLPPPPQRPSQQYRARFRFESPCHSRSFPRSRCCAVASLQHVRCAPRRRCPSRPGWCGRCTRVPHLLPVLQLDAHGRSRRSVAGWWLVAAGSISAPRPSSVRFPSTLRPSPRHPSRDPRRSFDPPHRPPHAGRRLHLSLSPPKPPAPGWSRA